MPASPTPSIPPTDRHGLHYPHGRCCVPAPDTLLENADGVFWLRMPLIIGLDRINL